MKYRNTKTGAESNTFSERDWASGTPQRKGWIKVDEDKLRQARTTLEERNRQLADAKRREDQAKNKPH